MPAKLGLRSLTWPGMRGPEPLVHLPGDRIDLHHVRAADAIYVSALPTDVERVTARGETPDAASTLSENGRTWPLASADCRDEVTLVRPGVVLDAVEEPAR